MFSKEEVENIIKDYYIDKYKKECLHSRIEMLCKQVKDIEQDIDNSNISLNGEVHGIDYSRGIGSASKSASIQENEIERAFLSMERDKQKLETQILEAKIQLRHLQQSCYEIEYAIGLLSGHAQQFIDLRYRQQKSYYYISQVLHISETSVSRLRDSTIKELAVWLDYFSSGAKEGVNQ